MEIKTTIDSEMKNITVQMSKSQYALLTQVLWTAKQALVAAPCECGKPGCLDRPMDNLISRMMVSSLPVLVQLERHDAALNAKARTTVMDIINELKKVREGGEK